MLGISIFNCVLMSILFITFFKFNFYKGILLFNFVRNYLQILIDMNHLFYVCLYKTVLWLTENAELKQLKTKILCEFLFNTK